MTNVPPKTPSDEPFSGSGPHAALRKEVACFVALLGRAEDFAAMRQYSTFAFATYGEYLRRMQGLLRSLAGQCHIRVALFDPVAYASYCADCRLDPDTAASRSRYTAIVATPGPTIAYTGQPMDRILVALSGEVAKRSTWQRAAELLTEANDGGAGNGQSSAALRRASDAFKGLIDSLGAGTHHLVCTILDADGKPLIAALDAEGDAHGTVHLVEADALVFHAILAAGIALGRPGGIVARTTRDPATSGAERVQGWMLRNRWLQPLTESEVFNAYCTDPVTGEPVPPESGVTYCAGTDIQPSDE